MIVIFFGLVSRTFRATLRTEPMYRAGRTFDCDILRVENGDLFDRVCL